MLRLYFKDGRANNLADTGKQMDSELPSMQKSIDEKMELLGQRKVLGTVEKVKELLESERFKNTA